MKRVLGTGTHYPWTVFTDVQNDTRVDVPSTRVVCVPSSTRVHGP